MRLDDGEVDAVVAAHLCEALPRYFGEENWGAEGRRDDDGWPKGRIKAVWTGIIGMSADTLPWVGRIPPKLSGRASCTEAVMEKEGLSFRGEWIAVVKVVHKRGWMILGSGMVTRGNEAERVERRRIINKIKIKFLVAISFQATVQTLIVSSSSSSSSSSSKETHQHFSFLSLHGSPCCSRLASSYNNGFVVLFYP